MTPSRSDFLTVRGLRTHVRHWGREGAPKIFMLHGWMDVGASFQFVVDHLHGDWHVIAPDWRGFGLTERAGTDTYWFPDYLADLDALLRHYQPEGQVNLVGHSMGGNIAGIYAGVRPERIRRFVNLEGFGLTGAKPEDAPGRYAKWLDELLDPPAMKGYPTREAVAARLQKTNPRLTDERAAFLARHWSAQNAAGEWEILGDPVHKQASPLPYHAEDIMACWRRITAPVLWVEAADTNMWLWLGGKEEGRREVDRRMAHIADITPKMVPDAGHMLHHDQPAMLAAMIVQFLA
ncbi:alpha/beta fold hydrolase [Pseudoduganella umbonata]|uniref:Alpha/beta hydrolase n=1 Tax=Pseudoduganella umbonata TaxID=864828 RepID=A0A4P8HS26_9BURK|nr:alpha/beta hydrolase [Pseudoduganella umbonata]MBB3224295.1 pimeloyl-ACP methyl ester carboxylesterase [Pseudoduganella umbonata]QCP11324.1 alpha/beta hydrolase [Pseudoduganella umbonata]